MKNTFSSFIVLMLGIVFGAFAIQTIIALIGVAFATAIDHPGAMMLSVFYCWPVFWLSAAATLAIMLTKCCACWVKKHMCCPLSCKTASDVKETAKIASTTKTAPEKTVAKQ